ncbi:acyl--CoA ligase [Nocardioides sp. Root1257]|uniref:AMP-binding protein n=1 Tax=unclassified Nocardioides TaxID=2615069 RepID=UPI0006F429DA|nr:MULTISPECIES: AMP-binding protein [unclassified Nocardioides]KQW45240.1 acyl--CoA ligase [Nocardioides sp. Root1257]KRC46073.1 acyl--CoA ligase [Nocardioides sp. Root224]
MLEETWGPWQPRTTAQLLDRVTADHPDRPYVVTDARTWTYHDLAELSIDLAAGLHAIGIRAGDHVAVDMANFVEAVALKFAVARLGAVSVSVNFMLRHQELGYVLRQSRSTVLITMDSFRGLDYLAELDQLAPGWDELGGGDALPDLREVIVFATQGGRPARGTSLDDLLQRGAEVPRTGILELTASGDPEAVSDLLYTSGTTGKAKGVLLTHDGVLRTAYSSALHRALPERFRIMYAMPLYHVFGYVEATVAVLFVAGSIVPKTMFDGQEMLRAVARHDVDEIMCVPAMTSVLLEKAKAGSYDLSSLTSIFSSGTPHPEGMFAAMDEVFGIERIYTAYGQTETTASTMCTLPGDGLDRLTTTNGTRKPGGCAGDPSLEGSLAVYKVVDIATGDELPFGEIGALLTRGPIITQGYFDKPVETAELFTDDGWMQTGDLGRVDEQGYLSLTGRQKESYRFGGELVIPSDVEEVLVQHEGVLEAHVVGIPHERYGDVGCAWVVVNPAAPPAAEDLIAFCAARVARFKVPASVLFIDASDLPRTVTGRVQKFLLIERAIRMLAAADTVSV